MADELDSDHEIEMSDSSSQSTVSFQEVQRPELRRVSVSEAINYMALVKVVLGANSKEYSEFLDVFQDFKAQRITTLGVKSRVQALFAEHQELVEGFNQFLPAGHEIPIPVSVKLPNESRNAVNFVTKVKAAFPQHEGRYSSFLNFLNQYRSGDLDLVEVTKKVVDLFQDRPDLVEDFFHFLPETKKPEVQKALGRRRMKESSMLLYLLALALSVLVAIGIGVWFGVHPTKS